MKSHNPTSMATLTLKWLKCHTGFSVVKTCEMPSNNILLIQGSNKIEQIGQQGGRYRHTNSDTLTASLFLQDT